MSVEHYKPEELLKEITDTPLFNRNALLDKIQKYAYQKNQTAKQLQKIALAEYNAAKGALETLEFQQRIHGILKLANEAVFAEVPIDQFYAESELTFSKNEKPKIGFIRPEPNHIIEYCGFVINDPLIRTSLFVGKTGPIGMRNVSTKFEPKYTQCEPITAHMLEFLTAWPDFEARFTTYLNEICPN